jgi:hypothetical protein
VIAVTGWLLLVSIAAFACKGHREPPPVRIDGGHSEVPQADAAPVAPTDAFAPLRRVGAEWRYEVQARRKQELEPLAGVTAVLRVADVAVQPGHAVVTLTGRMDPSAAQAPPALVRELEQPMRFMLLPDGLVQLLPPPQKPSVEHAAASLADREVRDGDIMLPSRYVDGWRIRFAAKDASGEAQLLRSHRMSSGRDVEVWTLAWESEVAVPPLRKRPWKWRKIRYQVAYSPEVGFITLDGLGADFVLTLRE